MPHIATLLDHTLRRSLRQTLLRMLHSLILPTAAEDPLKAAALAAAKANGVMFVTNAGMGLVVDLLTCALLKCEIESTCDVPDLYWGHRSEHQFVWWNTMLDKVLAIVGTIERPFYNSTPGLPWWMLGRRPASQG